MSQEEGEHRLFDDRSFWLKMNISFDEVVEDAKRESIPVSLALIDEFLKRKRKIVESRFESIQDFKTMVRDADDPESVLLPIFAESLWIQSPREGTQFEYVDEAAQEIQSIEDDDFAYEDVNDEFGIIWPTETKIRRVEQDGEIVGTSLDEAHPVVLRKTENGVTVLGSSGTQEEVATALREQENIEEMEPTTTSERVTDKVRNLLDDEADEFKIIGVKYHETELPERSRLRIKNERAVYADISALSRKNIISIEGVSNIQKFYLKDNRYGGKYRVNVIHGNDGFRFELEGENKLERERDRFKRRFTSETGIEFGTVYNYGSQNQRLLFNRILSEDGDAYNRYYNELEESLQEVVDNVADVKNRELKRCVNADCREYNRADVDVCRECGGSAFTESFETTEIQVSESRVGNLIQDLLRQTTPTHEKMEIVSWSTSGVEMNSRSVIRSDFQLTEYEGPRASTSRGHQVFFVPQGNRSRPGTINNYLLKCVYVTFGESAIDDYEGYGRLSLYDLVVESSIDHLVGKAIRDAIVGTRSRTFRNSAKAHDQAQEYLELLNAPNALPDHREELEDYYDPSNDAYFEKHVFYLLKGLFSQTERWGRTAKKEADGLLIIPLSDSTESYAAKYDVKLSHRVDGYDLTTSEEDQASRYMTNEAETHALRNKTGAPYPSAHILISQNFDESGFGLRAKGIQKNLSEYDESDQPDLVFLEFRAIVDLFTLQNDHYQALEHPDVRARFHDYVLEELRDTQWESEGKFVHVDCDSISRIRERLLSTIDQYDLDTVQPYSG